MHARVFTNRFLFEISGGIFEQKIICWKLINEWDGEFEVSFHAKWGIINELMYLGKELGDFRKLKKNEYNRD